MENKIYMCDEGFLCVDFYGDQNNPTITKISGEIRAKTKELRSQNKPVLMLVSLVDLGMPDVRSMTLTREEISTFDMDKMAVFGVQNKFVENVISTVVDHAGLDERIRYFKTKEEAVNWLSE